MWLDIGVFCGYKRKMQIAESHLQPLCTVCITRMLQTLLTQYRLCGGPVLLTVRSILRTSRSISLMMILRWKALGCSGYDRSRSNGMQNFPVLGYVLTCTQTGLPPF